MFILVPTTLLSTRFRLGPIALIALFVVGLDLRISEFGLGVSDVATVVKVGINAMLTGQNPYLIQVTSGVSAFPYGPIALLWYLPLNDPRLQEFGLSIVLLGVLALRGQPMGLALWAAAPLTIRLASDGSNDHTAALLLLVAILVLERAPRAGALLIGLAAGFKIYALAWLPPIFVWAGAGAFVIGIVAAVAVWLPVLVIYGLNVFAAFQASEEVHKVPFYSLGELLYRAKLLVPKQTLDLVRLIFGAATALAVSPFARSHRAVVVAGMAIYLVTLYTGFWSSPAYLIPLMLLICWYIDLWLSRDDERIRWPTDPVGRITAAVDARWPTVDSQRSRLESPAHDD
jgi:hypothetical protein